MFHEEPQFRLGEQMIKKFRDIPKKIYVYEGRKAVPYEYDGTDMEEPVAPFLATSYHIFVKNRGKIDQEKLEVDVFEFDIKLNEEMYFTTKRGGEAYGKKCLKEEIERTKRQIEKLRKEIKEMEKAL